jgi:two-component system, NarL family, sensor histidine kinase DevS
VESDKLRLSIASSERERRRWARELHDETLQELGALMLLHDTALKRGDAEVMRRSLERARDQIQQTIAGLEGLITELRPAALDELGVAAALEALIDHARAASGLRVSADLDLAFGDGRARLAPELESTLYRLAQEALNNVMKHAQARNVRISMEALGDSLVLTVADDGRGFDVEDAPQRFGLVGMRERVVLAGGELEVESEPGAGTRVIAKLPLAYAAEGGAG